MRVLDRDDARRRLVRILGLEAARTSFGREHAVLADDLRLHAGERGERAGLVAPAVRAVADDHLVAGLGMGAQRDLVRHRAARHEQRGLEAEQLGDALLEPTDRRILAVDVVADLGIGHRVPHRGSTDGDGIASKVDGRWHAPEPNTQGVTT